jgi:inner membrane transporter RhtA
MFWAAYILASAHVGRTLPGTDGLAVALVVATLLVLPFGLHGASAVVQRPALLLLDLSLPDLRGEDLAKVAQARYGPALPVLVVTGASQAQHRASAAGSLVYLAKPFELATLVGIVRALLALGSLG